MITMCNYIIIYYNIYDILVFDDPYDTQQLTSNMGHRRGILSIQAESRTPRHRDSQDCLSEDISWFFAFTNHGFYIYQHIYQSIYLYLDI